MVKIFDGSSYIAQGDSEADPSAPVDVFFDASARSNLDYVAQGLSGATCSYYTGDASSGTLDLHRPIVSVGRFALVQAFDLWIGQDAIGLRLNIEMTLSAFGTLGTERGIFRVSVEGYGSYDLSGKDFGSVDAWALERQLIRFTQSGVEAGYKRVEIYWKGESTELEPESELVQPRGSYLDAIQWSASDLKNKIIRTPGEDLAQIIGYNTNTGPPRVYSWPKGSEVSIDYTVGGFNLPFTGAVAIVRAVAILIRSIGVCVEYEARGAGVSDQDIAPGIITKGRVHSGYLTKIKQLWERPRLIAFGPSGQINLKQASSWPSGFAIKRGYQWASEFASFRPTECAHDKVFLESGYYLLDFRALVLCDVVTNIGDNSRDDGGALGVNNFQFALSVDELQPFGSDVQRVTRGAQGAQFALAAYKASPDAWNDLRASLALVSDFQTEGGEDSPQEYISSEGHPSAQSVPLLQPIAMRAEVFIPEDAFVELKVDAGLLGGGFDSDLEDQTRLNVFGYSFHVLGDSTQTIVDDGVVESTEGLRGSYPRITLINTYADSPTEFASDYPEGYNIT